MSYDVYQSNYSLSQTQLLVSALSLWSATHITAGIVYCVMLWLHVKYNYFSLHRCLSEIILFQNIETCLKLFRRLTAACDYFRTCSFLSGYDNFVSSFSVFVK